MLKHIEAVRLAMISLSERKPFLGLGQNADAQYRLSISALLERGLDVVSIDGVVRLKPQLVPSVDFHAQEAICSCRQADHPLLNFFAFSHARSLQLGP
jgi:hypothetical protein